MSKYIIILITLLLTGACKNNIVTEETKYFSFERPAELAFDTIIYFESVHNIKKANKATGHIDTINATIEGKFVIDNIDVYFTLKNPASDFLPTSCSDYSEEYFKTNGEVVSIDSHEFRIVEGESSNSYKQWIELCIDMKHQFFVKEVNENKVEMIKSLLKTIKITY